MTILPEILPAHPEAPEHIRNDRPYQNLLRWTKGSTERANRLAYTLGFRMTPALC